MKKQTALLAALLTVSAPAFADSDERHYQANKAQYISYEKAGEAAAAKVGGTVEQIDFEYSKRRGAYFEVEVRDQDGQEYEVEVDAKTGEILSSRQED